MDSQQTTHREEEFSYPPFKPKKGSLFISLLIAVVVFCFVASALAIVLTANVELIEENVDKLLIRLMITFVGALAASIAAALLFKRFVKKKEKAGKMRSQKARTAIFKHGTFNPGWLAGS